MENNWHNPKLELNAPPIWVVRWPYEATQLVTSVVVLSRLEGFKIKKMLGRKRPRQKDIGSWHYRFYRVNKNHDEKLLRSWQNPVTVIKNVVHGNRDIIWRFYQFQYMKIIYLLIFYHKFHNVISLSNL